MKAIYATDDYLVRNYGVSHPVRIKFVRRVFRLYGIGYATLTERHDAYLREIGAR